MRPGDPSHHGRQRRGLGVRLFHWLSAMQIPAAYDLRRRGWCMAERAAARSAAQPAPALAPVDVAGEGRWSFLAPWLHRPLRQQVLILGVEDSRARACLLRLGFGDVAGADLALDEVEARTIRIAEQAALVPRDRRLGPLRLELAARDGYVDDRALGLHPREFALLWRLAETPGRIVSKRELLRDVWRLHHVPDTNSLAVHVSRLRAKLAVAGLPEVVQTAPCGGYFLKQQPGGAGALSSAGYEGLEAMALARATFLAPPWEPE